MTHPRLSWFLLMAVWLAAALAGAQTIQFSSPEIVAGLGTGGGGRVGQYASLAHDPEGGQYIAYYDELLHALKYAHRPGPFLPWTLETLDNSGIVGLSCNLALGPRREHTGLTSLAKGDRQVTVDAGLRLARAMIGGSMSFNNETSPTYLIANVLPNQHRIELASFYTGTTFQNRPYIIHYYQPAIAYQDATVQRSLKVARPAGEGGWAIETVDPQTTATTQSWTGFSPSAAVDGLGRVHLAWQDRQAEASTQGRLRYAMYDGIQWTYETPDDTPNRADFCRLAVDKLGRPFIFYRDTASSQSLLMTARFGAGTWTPPSVVDFGEYTGRAIDAKYVPATDRFVVSYQDAPDSSTQERRVIYLHVNVNGETLNPAHIVAASGPGYGEYTSVASGPNEGTQELVFYDAVNRDLLACTYNTANARYNAPFTLDHGLDVGSFCSADINPANGLLYVAYYDANIGALKLARFDGQTAQTEFVDGIKVGSFSDIALVGGDVVVAYHNDMEGSLHVARWPKGGAPRDGSDILVDADTANVGENVTMATDSAGHIFIVYYDKVNQDLRLAVYSNGLWRKSVIMGNNPPAAVGEYCRLAIEPVFESELAVVFYNQDEDSLYYATANLAGVNLDHQIVQFNSQPAGTGHGTGRYCSLAYDRGHHLYAACYSETEKLPILIGFTQSRTPIQHIKRSDLTAEGLYTSMAMQSTGFPALAYYDAIDGALIYGEMKDSPPSETGPPTNWKFWTVDTQGDTGLYPVLRIDLLHNSVYTLYNDITRGEIKLASRLLGAPDWSAPVAVAEAGYWLRTALAIDRDGMLYVAYPDQHTGNLMTFATTRPPVANAVGSHWELFE